MSCSMPWRDNLENADFIHINQETGEVNICKKTAPLHAYVVEMRLDKVRELVNEGVSIDSLFHGHTPLHIACKYGCAYLVERLLELGADIHAESELDHSKSLHYASRAGKFDIVKILLNHHAQINATDAMGNTPLWFAAHFGHEDVLQYLICYGGDINRPNMSGQTPLAAAVMNGYVEVLRRLISSGCSVNWRDHAGNAPIHHAVNGGQQKITQLLVKAKAEVNRPNNAGDYPIVTASLHGKFTIIDNLVQGGCDVNVTTASGSPLYLAVQRQHKQAVQKLISAGANCEVWSDENYTPPPLIESVRTYRPNTDIVLSLVRAGCNVDIMTAVFDTSPLVYALMAGHKDVVSILLAAECRPPASIEELGEYEDEEIIKEVTAYIRTPLPLKRQCRRAIRAVLGYGNKHSQKVESLGVPHSIQCFLAYADIDTHLLTTHL